jgi:hypothetical protein
MSELDRVAAASREEEVLKIFKMLDPRPKVMGVATVML